MCLYDRILIIFCDGVEPLIFVFRAIEPAIVVRLAEVMALIDREEGDPPGTRPMEAAREKGPVEKGVDDRKNDRTNVPLNDRNRGSSEPPPEDGLNPRQRWYLEALAAGKELRANDLRHRWGVSEKTARRDVAVLKERGIIEFVGPPRTGRYRRRS